jgi:hypothetical protein
MLKMSLWGVLCSEAFLLPPHSDLDTPVGIEIAGFQVELKHIFYACLVLSNGMAIVALGANWLNERADRAERESLQRRCS